MTQFTREFVLNRPEDAHAAADYINAAVADKMVVAVNGQTPDTRPVAPRRPASGWQVGSMSLAVRARTTNGYNLSWFRPGTTVTVEVSG